VAGIAYLDTSALVKLVLVERGSSGLGDFARTRSVVSSDLARVELPRAIRRLGFEGRAAELADRLLSRIVLLKLDRATLSSAATVDPAALRSLDAIHLASAMSVPELESFVTYDRRLADAAEQAGLRVESPA
jgi:predicted nucleic acid-binding protein